MKRDIMLTCLFENNKDILNKLISECAPRVERLGIPESTHKTLQSLLYVSHRSVVNSQCVFIALLSADVQLKELLVKGMPEFRLDGMCKEKAELFFMGLDAKIITPWLGDERMSSQELVQKTKEFYLVC